MTPLADTNVGGRQPDHLAFVARQLSAEDTYSIIYDPASKSRLTFNGDAHSSIVIDPREGKLITNIPRECSPPPADI
ncbi:MAG: hypothetical protein J2P21_15545 [Chloracidobacterium sp.]|nr:hypothetical protein [Chloracidobacterium sp.]